LAREGADIAIWDVKTEESKKVADEVKALGRRVLVQKVDVTRSAEVYEAAQVVIKELGKVDILVNCAGSASAAPTILELADERWDVEIAVNLTSTYYCTKAVLQHMIDRRSGKIVNISSMAGELGRPITSAGYSAAKAGVQGFTMSVARSVAKYGITVNAVSPGIILTDVLLARFSAEQLENMQAGIPLNRGGVEGARGIPQDIADAVLFLASNESDYITGTRIRVNGGSLMG
jgi:NAD(P)-dependent dehydrogenase (short-subunit alcohol dehydrogenase family)